MLQEVFFSLQAADNALIIGHRLSEWCGHGPVLEQDIALTNMALDHLGQARSFYQYAADVINKLSKAEKEQLFTSPALSQKIDSETRLDEDDLAYLRDAWDFRNVLLVEQPNKDWAYTVARSFFYDTFSYYFYKALQHSKNQVWAAIAEKSVKEAAYHVRWSSEWVIRLGDGTDESHLRMTEAIQSYGQYTSELTKPTEIETALISQQLIPDLAEIKVLWEQHIQKVLEEAKLEMPSRPQLPAEGKSCIHAEHLGYILAEMQFMQRAYPGMSW